MLNLKRLFNRTKQPPQPQFTDTQIAERAYVLWQARQVNGKAGTEAEDWSAAKVSLQIEHALPKGLRSLWSPAQSMEAQKTALELHKLQLERWKVWIAGFGVLATVLAGVGLYLTYSTGQAQLESAQQERQLNSERLVTDRFAKAVEQLGSKEPDVRIGAIYSLERLAKDSPKDHWTIMEVLTAFVRSRSPLSKDWKPGSKQELAVVTTDVQATLTVLGRRDLQHDPEGQHLNLKRTNLKGINLNNTNLPGAYLIAADLEGAYLIGTNFSGAGLSAADLSGANLIAADLEGAYLIGTNFSGAVFDFADIRGADLEGAKNLTPAQIKAAKNWQTAHYDPDFRKELGLPPEKPQP